MSTQVEFRRGTTAQHATFTGAAGEMTVNTDTDRVVIHDAVKAGGFETPNFDDLQAQRMVHAAASGTNTLTATLTPVPIAYVTGMRVSLKAANNNTAAVTINLNALGAKSLKKNGGVDELGVDDIVAGQMFAIEFDGTDFQVTSGTGGAAGGGLTSIQNTTITAVTNIDMTGFAPGTYDNYEVWISNGQPANNLVFPEMETSTDGGTTFDSLVTHYTWAGQRVSEGGVGVSAGDADDGDITLSLDTSVGNAANENISAKINVFGPAAAEFTAFTWTCRTRNQTTLLIHCVGSGDRQSAADVDGLRFHWSAGAWVAQGKIQFLGIALI